MATRDWSGNRNSIYKTLGASNHTEEERETNDFYATDPMAIDVLLSVEDFSKKIWECSCGMGHMSGRLKMLGHEVVSTDLIYRGYGNGNVDFLNTPSPDTTMDIITNPPYKFAAEFVEHGIQETGNKLALFLKLQFLEGQKRKHLFRKYPPKYVYVSSSRILCAKNADFEGMIAGGGSAVAYAWYVWYKGFTGDTVLRWVN